MILDETIKLIHDSQPATEILTRMITEATEALEAIF
jgi:hypothetical protein